MNSAFLWNTAILLALMAVAAVIEVFIPLFTRGESSKGRITPNLSLTAVNLSVNWLLTAVTAIVALDLKPPALLSALPFAIQVLVTAMLLDFMYGYVSHVLLHKIPMLWQFHRVHHSDPFVDVTTLQRQHPVETVWRFLFVTIPAWALGLPAHGRRVGDHRVANADALKAVHAIGWWRYALTDMPPMPVLVPVFGMMGWATMLALISWRIARRFGWEGH